MYSIFKLTNKENEKSYYGKTRCKFNILINLMRNYENNKDLKYYEILKDRNYSIDIVMENLGLEEIKHNIKDLIENDKKCIQYKEPQEENIKVKKIIPTVIKKIYNKKGYEKYRDSGKSAEYYEKNKEKIRAYQKNKYNELKEKLKKLAELENKTN